MTQRYDANRWKRFDDWDARALRLDQFAIEDPQNGFSAFHGQSDPKPGLTIKEGKVTSMDGVAEKDFDLIDAFIATYHLDTEIAQEAMSVPSRDLARMLVDMNVPRTDLTRIARGLTPAKLAEAALFIRTRHKGIE